MVSNALIQGASRGIGLQMCRYLLARQTKVIATCREPANALELSQLQSQYGDLLRVFRLDVQDETQIKDVSAQVDDRKLDLLINCAGILHPSGKGETSLREVNLSDVTSTLKTNAIGPLLMAKYFGSNLSKRKRTLNPGNKEAKARVQGGATIPETETTAPDTGTKTVDAAGILVNMSARVGSVTDNWLGGWYSYRMSKAALNMATKNLSIELGRKNVICVSLHPGTVNTDLSSRYLKNVDPATVFTPEFSVDCLMNIIYSLELKDNDQGTASLAMFG
ncbi:1-hydroxy-2-glutathionyl-2-methyl-3-butene dehydrogenase-like isoform X2 [Montipora capricornis]|uniref:1-hydroxy-2-glutathionyl-2-methyl-3-butene dehydrogenase-like isoform X2 n=1 Tax=Montipora capricornis TaxID=246305 RepID=UPI0035F209DD